MDDLPPLDPETLRIGKEMFDEAMKSRKGRPVSQFIAEDHTPRPYSVRLTPGELHRLRGLARATEVEASKLARQFILQGMVKLEAELDADEGAARHIGPREEIKETLLRAYIMIDDMAAALRDRPPAPFGPPPSEPT